MNDRTSLPAIHPYDIERHYYLHEIRQERAKQRVHGMDRNHEIKAYQRKLCKTRKDHK